MRQNFSNEHMKSVINCPLHKITLQHAQHLFALISVNSWLTHFFIHDFKAFLNFQILQWQPQLQHICSLKSNFQRILDLHLKQMSVSLFFWYLCLFFFQHSTFLMAIKVFLKILFKWLRILISLQLHFDRNSLTTLCASDSCFVNMKKKNFMRTLGLSV